MMCERNAKINIERVNPAIPGKRKGAKGSGESEHLQYAGLVSLATKAGYIGTVLFCGQTNTR